MAQPNAGCHPVMTKAGYDSFCGTATASRTSSCTQSPVSPTLSPISTLPLASPLPVAAPALPLRASVRASLSLSASGNSASFPPSTYEPSREPTLTFGRRPAPAKLRLDSLDLTSLARPLNTLEHPIACRSTSWFLLLIVVPFSRLLTPTAARPAVGPTAASRFSLDRCPFPPWSLHKERDHSHQILRRPFRLAVTIHPIHRTLAS